MARWLRQIWLLVWKNFILQIRRPIGTTVEILLPVAFASLLIVAKIGLYSEKKAYCFSTFRGQDGQDIKQSISYNQNGKTLAFFPSNSWTYEIMQNASKRLTLNATSHDFDGNPFTSEDQTANVVAGNYKRYFGAIIFENGDSPTMPKKVKYKIRLSSVYYYDGNQWYDDPWNTRRVYPQFKQDGPRGDYGPNYKESFLPLQWSIDKTIIAMQTGQSNWSVADYLNKFPYPKYSVDTYIQSVQFLMPLVFSIAFIYTAVTMTKELVAEKQSQLKESMKMMGLANWIHWLSWFLKNLLFLTLSCIFLTIMLKAAKVLEHTHWSLVFIFFICYSISMIFFAFAVSVFFSNPILSMLFGAVLWLGTSAPYLALAAPGSTTYDTLTLSQKAALCLLPNTCLGIGTQVITKMEAAGIGAQWGSINEPPSIDDDFSLGLVFIMMLVQSFMWWIITWYVEAVFPGQYGVSKPFYFFLTPSYWCGISCGKNCSSDNEKYGTPMISQKSDPNVEKADSNLQVGVHIEKLRKVFSSSTGNKVAVDDLSLEMYKGQITALLGHNGAGKTTTMSMLTGLYQPTGGTATVGGRSILTDMDRIRDSLGLCPQHNVLFDRLTVKEHLELFIALKGQKGQIAKQKIDQMLQDIQLVDKKDAKSVTLSGGMKRKLSCAMALIGDPDVVFLDEPTSGMDPYARRATWDLLQKYTTNKTVVLTTHFMDEADYLGDRIAIMANGSLRCCGSSLFLKKRYGVGYHLNLVKADQFQETAAQQLIESEIPRAKMVSNIGAEMRYVLEHESSKQFKGLFQHLEEQKDKLGIGSFGVSITTLEEVFLKVGEESNESTKDGDEIEIEPSVKERANTISRIVDKREILTGAALKMSQFSAMFVKRFLNSKRQKRAIFTQIILPAVMILCGLLLLKVTSSQVDEPPLVLDFSMLSKPGSQTNAYMADYRNDVDQAAKNEFKNFARSYYSKVRVALPDRQIIASDTMAIKDANLNNSVTVDGRKYKLTPTDKTPCCKYRRLVLNQKCKSQIYDSSSFKSLCGNDKSFGYANCQSCIDQTYGYGYPGCPIGVRRTNLNDPQTFYTEYILRKSNSKFFFRKFVTGVTLKNSTTFGRPIVTAWYSSEALHNIPSAFSAASNIILASVKKDAEYGIQVTNHPLPRTAKQKVQAISSSFGNLVLCVFVTMAASFIAASFVPYLITEKSTKAKHVQFVSGVDSRIYWFASFCWDFINFLVPAIIIIILFASFQIDGYKGGDLGILCLVILLYGLAVLPFCYCLSFIFKSALISYAVIALVGLLVSMAAVFAVFFCRLPGSNFVSIGTTLNFIFLVFPIYSLPSAVMDMGTYSTLKQTCKKSPGAANCRNLPSSSIGLEYPGVGWACVYMVIECFFYLILAVLIEERFFVKCKSNAIISRNPDEEEDHDVAKERIRVSEMGPHDIGNEAVVVQHLSKVFRSNNLKAVDALYVAIPKKECFGLLGVNGAGKTTTFGMLTGELGITAGTAYLNGFNIQTQLREVQQRIGYCPQFDALLDKLTGREMLEMFAKLRGIPSHKIPDVVNSVIYQLNLAEWADKMCGNYSGGNKRKLSTAMALVGDPPIIFLDEPTSGMDPVSRRFLWNTLSSLLDDERSIILTSHSMEECEALCTRLVIMVNGQFKCLGSIQHLKSRFGQGYTLMIKIGKKEMERRRSSIKRLGSVKSRGESTASYRELVSPDVDILVPNEHVGLNDDAVESPAMIDKVKEFVQNGMPGAYLLDDRLGMLHYQILNPSLTWSYMFGILEENADRLDIIDYSLSQTTLEQVFINFAKHQRPELQKKKRCCCSCTC